jgi:cbb3-type cytochrome c oxidase subunit I
MYYFLPRAAERPVYSYRLSIIHFWALIFLYIWAGPHHLLYSALPEWAQTLGMVFSIVLLAPSWGGMLNGLLTMKGAWHRVRTDPVLKFFVVAVSFYGMSTFEGPMMSIRSVNLLSHYTNWTIGHVHSGALGWVGMVSFAMIYWLVPRLYGRDWAKPSWATTHFWLGTIGIVLYTVSMWAAGLTEGLQWRAIDTEGQLTYPSFVSIVQQLQVFYWLRLVGGTLFLAGIVMLLINYIATVRGAAPAPSARRRRGGGLRSADHVRRQQRPVPLAPEDRGEPRPDGGAHHHRHPHRRAGRDRADVHRERRPADARGRDALHAARAGRPRHLRAGGLLYLPLADGAPDPRRAAAVR